MANVLEKLDLAKVSLDEIFSNNDPKFIEQLAQASQKVTRQYFGRTISLYAPLYISNFCENECVYCGFQVTANIKRQKLTPEQIEKECQALAEFGIQNLLILTGESRSQSSVFYIKEAVKIAKKYFPNISLEVYPMETSEYNELFRAGVDGITLYQETYNQEIYKKLHLSGKKADYKYRYAAPARIAQAGIRYISLGVLLGLAPWQEDIKALFIHLAQLEKEFPGVEYSLSFPRIQKLTAFADLYEVRDSDMVKIISTARLLFPRAGINLSTRENAQFRDNIFSLGVTRMSAGSSTVVGGYSQRGSDAPQFAISDERSLAEIKKMLQKKEYDPVLTDWRAFPNE